MNELVSIIIPIYNTEKYLKGCLDSVISQTYKNIEVLLINDGSTDNSGLICDYYVQCDKRVKVFHNANNGVSYSRNYGINRALGRYILFIDADDTIDENYVEELVKEMNDEIDLCICGINDIYEKYNKKRKLFKTLTGNFYKDYHILVNFLRVPFAKIYKKEIIIKNKISFPVNISRGEDQIFNFNYYSNVKKYKYCDTTFYNYFHRESNSLSKIITTKSLMDAICKLKYEKIFMKNNGIMFGENILANDLLSVISDFSIISEENNNFNNFKKRIKFILKEVNSDCLDKYNYSYGWKRYIFAMLLNYRFYIFLYFYFNQRRR